MEECTRSKPAKLSPFKSRFQAHGAIARSLSPFFVRATRLESGDANAGRSLLAISGSCVCSSSTSAVIDAQVPACHRLAIEDIHGKVKNRYNASKSSAPKEMPKKSRFSNSFNKGYARVSDVSTSTSCHNGDALVSPKSSVKIVNWSRRMVVDSSRRMEDDTEGHGKPNFKNSCKNANSEKTDDSGGCHRSELSLSTHSEQGDLCKREKLNFAKEYLPVVEYTWDPCKAFYESMLEMVTVSSVDVYDDDLEDMFAYYLVLNSSHHHAHIKEAYTILLTNLYKSKLFTIKGLIAPHSL